MERDYISTNFLEIIAGTSNRATRAYVEAAKGVEEKTPKAMTQLKNFITSIENLASKDVVKDSRISSSKGNITTFKGYDNIQTAMNFLDKNLGKIDVMKDLHELYEALKSNQPLYVEGYQKNVRLIMLEYESAVYLLVTGLSLSMAENIDIVQNGLQIKIAKKSVSNNGPIIKTLHEFASQIGNRAHKEYLDALIKEKSEAPIKTDIKESMSFVESAVGDTLELIDTATTFVGRMFSTGKRVFASIKNSIFGILPLIRSALYLRYKKKADTILELDQQVQFIKMNIEQLQNMKNMDPAKKEEIIKKQEAYIEKYQKKAAKLRAELMDGEREASSAINKEDSEIKNSGDGDFVLEGGSSISEIFGGEDSHFFEQRPRIKNKPSNRSSAFVKSKRVENFSLFKHKPSRPPIKVSDEKNKSALCKRCYNEFYNSTKKPSIRLTPIGNGSPRDNDLKYRTKTKIGGNPYWPKKDKFPMYNGKPMLMVAQLNFSELPNLSGFPTSGILQFFCGTWWDTGKKVTTCVYHKTILSESEMLTEIPRSPLADDDPPIESMYLVHAKAEEVPMSIADEKFVETITPIYNRIFRDNVKDIFDLDRKSIRELWDLLGTNNGGCRIGGNPYFTQTDPRDSDDEVMLLQLDSENGMMWGDCGIANFFISKANLTSRKFNGNVSFTWDCL